MSSPATPGPTSARTPAVGWFADRPIAMKIISAVAIALVSAGAVAWIGLASLADANRQAREMVADDVAGMADLADTRMAMLEALAQVPIAALAESAEERQEHIELRETYSAEQEAAFEAYTDRGVP